MVYLKGLNGVRALSALLVLLGHIYNATHLRGEEDSRINSYGVTAFFVLSGFLITFLLLKEKQGQEVSISKFYFRRILRIWPLYFLYLGLAIIFTTTSVVPHFLFYIFFIPNVAWTIGYLIPLAGHYWTLGVEEQFYFFWPWIIKFSSKIILTLIGVLMGFMVVKIFVNLYFGGWSKIYEFIYYTRFDCMIIGGIGAALYHQKHWVQQGLSNYMTQIISWLVVLLFLLNKFHTFSIIDHDIFSAAIVVIILGQVNSQPLINLENSLFNFIGKISFGLYIYHPMIIEFAIQSPLKEIESFSLRTSIYYISITIGSLIVSTISYFFFEKFFLDLKDKFATPSISN